MQIEAMTVGTSAVQVPIQLIEADGIARFCWNGMRLLAREANSGEIYIGFDPYVTTATGNPIPKGPPGMTSPYTVPDTYFNGPGPSATHQVWVIASAPGQVLDWAWS